MADVEEILAAVKSTACPLNPCPSWLVKASHEVFGDHLLEVINTSLEQGVFPGPEVCEILLPITVFELSDDDFLDAKELGRFCLTSGKAEIENECRGVEGTGPLECDETGQGLRKNSEETHQSNDSDAYAGITDENEQDALPLVNGSCLPGKCPNDAGSLRRDDCTNPEMDHSGSFVAPEGTDCSENHDTQKTTEDSNRNAESGQQLPRTDRNAPAVNINKCMIQGAADKPADDSQKGKTHSPKSGCFKCDQCGLELPKEEHLVYHKAVHLQPPEGDTEAPELKSPGGSAVKLFKCLQCAYITPSFYNLQVHFATHTGKKPCKCHECGKSFRNSSHLKRHSWLHVRNSHKCSGCFFIGSTSEDLELHKKTCKEKGPAARRLRISPVRQESSGKQTNGKETQRSTSLCGNTIRFYNCEHCDYSTYTLDKLKVHMRIHTGEKPYACDLCQKVFRTSSHLKRHMLVHQKQEFNCSSCDYSTGTWLSLKQHITLLGKDHQQGKPPLPPKMHACEKCSYSTPKKENLKIHIRTHTGEKPYKCPQCGQAFRTSSHVKKHLPTHVRLRCDKCDFGTLDKCALQKHALTHQEKESSQDVYRCNKCRLTFSMLRIFQAHKKKHEKIRKVK